MNRQSASRKSFGMVMIVVALLLAACGSGDGDPTPTPGSGANQAVPTLPAGEATAQATGEISEDDLTVVTPNVPAADATTEVSGITDLTGNATAPATADAGSTAQGTPPNVVTSEGTPATSALVEGTSAEPPLGDSTPAGSTEAPITTPAADAAAGEATVVSSPAAVTGVSLNIAGDGTGGSGQPGERSSNIDDPTASPVASPVAVVDVEGCEIANVPPFTGTVPAYVTNAEVFFRQGPGTECTPVYEAPLPEGQAVTAIGGPVSQTTDGSVWIQVEVDGVPGWVSFDFIEPAG